MLHISDLTILEMTRYTIAHVAGEWPQQETFILPWTLAKGPDILVAVEM